MKKKLFGWKKTVLASVIAFAALMYAMFGAEYANARPYLGLSQTFNHAEITYAEMGYELSPKYRVTLAMTGEGYTSNGDQRQRYIATAYRVIDPQWCVTRFFAGCLKAGIGLAYTPDQKLIGETNFRLELIYARRGFFEIYVTHLSSAGLYNPNTGLDFAGVRYFLNVL